MLRKVKSLLLLLISVIKRCFCCLGRRRNSDEDLPVAIHTGKEIGQHNTQETNWEDWEAPSSIVCEGERKMSAVEQRIQQYREKKLMEAQRVEEVPKEMDLFENLAPKISKKPQVIIYARSEDDNDSTDKQNSFSCADAMMEVGGELGDWDEEGGEDRWADDGEEIDLDEVGQILQQQKQQQRYQQKMAREAKKKQELQQSRENRAGKLATRIS